MYWIKKEGDKPCNRVEIKSDGAFRKVFECGSEWEVQDVYFNEMNRDQLTVHFKKKEKNMAKKYIIELEDKVSENAKGEKLYFVKGFNNLSLDETVLKKLTPYEEKHEFQVGDVVELKSDVEDKAKIGIITKTTPDKFCILLADGGVRNPEWRHKDDTYTLKFIKSLPSSLKYLLSLITR